MENLKWLEFSNEKNYNYLLLRNDFSGAKKNYAVLFEEVRGKKINGISLFNEDRAIEFEFSDDDKLIFTFFPGKANCFYVCEKAILNSFKQRNEYYGKDIAEIFSHPDHATGKHHSDTVKVFLKSAFPKLGETYISEIIFRSGMNSSESIDSVKKDYLNRLADELVHEIENPLYLLYERDSSEASGNEPNFLLSLTELNHINVQPVKFRDINSLLNELVRRRKSQDKFSQLKSELKGLVQQKISNVEKKIKSLQIQFESGQKSDEFRKAGEAILNNLHLITKGNRELHYKNENGEDRVVKLKMELSPSDNAKAYFEKSKKQKVSLSILKEKMSKLENEKNKLIEELEKLNDMNRIKSLIKEEKKSEKEKHDETSRFRKFKVNDMYEVWVGKDSASNDLLTTKYSAPHDLWFHVRGASGSHTVLKISNKKDNVPKEAILRAAAIAAYYSKARNASSVPVAYCERKFVKKKKGFREGTVVMEREKVVFVKPSLEG